jgi:hypothetical protein
MKPPGACFGSFECNYPLAWLNDGSVECVVIKIVMVIENDWSLKLHQAQQAKGITLASTKSTVNERHSNTPTAGRQAVPGRDRSGERGRGE